MKRPPSLRPSQIGTLLIFVAALSYLGWLGYGALPAPAPTVVPDRWFDYQVAFQDVQAQCELGPRPTGSAAGWRTGDWIQEQLAAAGWQVEAQDFISHDLPARNIIARAGQGRVILLSTHYDTGTQSLQESDPQLRKNPNTAASTAAAVAILLELAQVLEKDKLHSQVWLVFLDAEANGEHDGLKAFLQSLDHQPLAAIHLHTIASIEHPLVLLPASNRMLSQNWLALAQRLGTRGRFTDTSPALQRSSAISLYDAAGIPALEFAELGAPNWRTSQDNCDHIDARSLAAPGQMLETLLEQNLLADFNPPPAATPPPSPTPNT